MKKSHQITLTPLSKESVPEPDFLVCKKCNVNKPKEAFRKANLWRAKVCMECDYANKKAKIAESKKEKDMYGFF
jgi:hypothetical protein